jgi:hypothetical protein
MRARPVRRRLVVIWVVLGALLAGIVMHEATDIFAPKPPPRTDSLPMFQFSEPELTRVDVMYKGQPATLMRNAAGDWFPHHGSHRHDHRHGETATDRAESKLSHSHAADRQQATEIAQRLALMSRMRADRRVRPEQDLEHYGLDNPQAIIAFYGRQGKGLDASQLLDVLSVGDLLPTQYAYYTMRAGDTELSLIPRYYIALMLASVFGAEQAPTPLPPRAETGSN